ncbi:hypothetical protein PtB15_5B363 [Puccinia triticina]|nr:hypothetical protein PtB15_5B363 [Puccinia triticina]
MADPPSKSDYNTHQPNSINSDVSSLFDVATGPPATDICEVHYEVSETPIGVIDPFEFFYLLRP